MAVTVDRSELLDKQFLCCVKEGRFPAAESSTRLEDVGLNSTESWALLTAQLASRHIDLMARQLKERNQGYYTIGSMGHEGNAAVAAALRPSDMAFLHYRSAAFMLQRAQQVPGADQIRDQLLSLCASSEDPIAGGRHKVFGSLALSVPPQTSTIASQLPKAVGAALSITRAKELNLAAILAKDSVVLCSFGDASLNHSTAQGAINTAAWVAYVNYPLPLIFLCEDNGLGISVPTPKGWVQETMHHRTSIHYIAVDGLNIADVYRGTTVAVQLARIKRQPVFLHFKAVRLLGHAGSDIETQYRRLSEIEETEFQDPLLHTARLLLEEKHATTEKILHLYEETREKVREIADWARQRPKLTRCTEVMQSIVPPRLSRQLPPLPDETERSHCFGEQYAQRDRPRNLCQSINMALTDLMLQYKNIVVFGEDVARKGGVYRVTADLMTRFSQRRVFDSVLDEQTILGHAIGFGMNGFIPIPEIQFLAYLHNAEDQLRGEAATLSFFSQGQYTNPMVIRIAGLAYQKGFGGHFHNDNSIAVLRDIPGIIIACPARADEAAAMLRTCVEMAFLEQRVIIFLEPIALYMTKDLHVAGDNEWLFSYPTLEKKIAMGTVGIEGQGKDAVIVTYGNGYYLALQAAKLLKETHNIDVTVINLRWLAPLPEQALLTAVAPFQRVLIVDECRRTGSLSEALMALFLEQCTPLPCLKRLTAADTFIPLGQAWQYVLPSRDDIIQEICAMVKQGSL